MTPHTLLANLVLAMSDDEAEAAFDYIERMHAIPASDEDEESEE